MPGLRVPDSPANRDLLDYLRTFALPSSKLDLDGWELHTHPDLMSWFGELAGSPRGLVPVLGIVTIVHKGVIVAAAMGTDTLLFRLPEPPVGVELDDRIRELEPAS